MAKRYLALAMLASALWGISYPITYLALRLYRVEELVFLSYFFSVISFMVILSLRGYDVKSIIKGLALSPINYALAYLYTELSGDVGGLTSLLSSSYIVPLLILEYFDDGKVNTRYLVSAVTLLSGLYLLFQGYDDSIYIAFLLMIMNLVYTLVLAKINDVDIVNLVFGQSLGTLAISYLVMINSISISALNLNIHDLYYPLILSLIGNSIPYTLYAMAIKYIGPTETSLTSSVETISSLISSIPIQQLPANPVAWTLLIISILSISTDLDTKGMRLRKISIHVPIQLTASLNETSRYAGTEIMQHDMYDLHVIMEVPGKRKII
ncbi:MAG: EamA family transporter [Vulcanisaeta sp.]